ncbi:relaxase/mobilization nuclease domain-containing protein [Slackia exigua]|uniref:relaxase/mobilization nuclease domain-containing protein n=1 Tax=Slackia exigua TaxID=84109 RepID=UPI003AB94919
MPYVKCISGHTSSRGVQGYLEKNGRALATDFLNIDAPVRRVWDGLEDHAAFEWWREMDSTRHSFGNDAPWNGQRTRTWKHYILSPNPEDGIGLGTLRRLVIVWAKENFSDYEAAIVYHDDNENGIPHVHVVVNNTNLVTGRRIQEPDPKAVKRSVQKLAREMGLSCFEDAAGPAKAENAKQARTRQKVHVGRAERELEAKGEYSWVADIRARVSIARMVARNEEEFKSVMKAMGPAVEDNSANAPWRDWVYSFDDRPTLRVSGKKMGLSLGKEHLARRFASGSMGRLADATEREVFRIAARAYEVGDIAELKKL